MVAAAIAPPIAGKASTGRAAGLVTAATTPTTPNSANPAIPIRGRLTDTTPSAIDSSPSTVPIPTRSASLSCDPNVRIAKLLSHSGEASIADWPTVTIGDASGFTIPARSCATPIATPPQTTPIATPAI